MEPIQDRTDEELKQIAIDFVAGKVFTNQHVDGFSVGIVFTPLIFIGEIPENLGLIFEYIDKAGPRSINGYPMFTSCQFLNQHDLTILIEKIDKVKEALNAV